MLQHVHQNQKYLDPKVKLESEEHAEGYADEVVASDVDVGNHCLPPTADGHTFHQSSSEQKSVSVGGTANTSLKVKIPFPYITI